MIINPASLVSGASIFYSYWSTPADLSGASETSPVPDPNYLVCSAAAKLMALDEDRRAADYQGEADKILGGMLRNEVVKGEAYDNRTKTIEETTYGFRLGRDKM